ncbi:hypothetical protein [Psychrobacter celer]|uniref:hypothetical protein n=1 Tax=Psychrobacter celer TaxID=306572 RepID=UPI003FD02FC5
MIHLSYTIKCWALGVAFFVGFYFMVLLSDPSFSKYVYMSYAEETVQLDLVN